MATQKLEASGWRAYLDNVSRVITGQHTEIEIAGLAIGDQIEAKWLPLTGLTYDSKGDLFEVATETVDHLIRQPKEIYVEYGADGLHSVEVIDADGNHQIIKLKSPIALEALKD
ncbi:MAG: DUF5335 domain-containing protein [Gammaproteobacteria bacterium]|nr:DUF5335 domain-containing protein [Gammaproteobacteria bacterium]